MPRYKIANITDIAEGEVKVFKVADERIALGMAEGKYYAIDDICTHDGGPLGEGILCGCEIECPRHGALFDMRTGEALTLPATAGVRAYQVTVENDELFIEIDD